MDTLRQSYRSSCGTWSSAVIHVRPPSRDVVGIPKRATTIPSPNIRLPQCHQVPQMTPPTAPAPARTQDTTESARTHPMLEPAPSPSLVTGSSIQRLPPPSGTPRRPRTSVSSGSDSTTSTTRTTSSAATTTSSSSTPAPQAARKISQPGPANPSPPQAPAPPPRSTPQLSPRLQPGRNPRPPPSSHPNPSPHRGLSLLPYPSASPSLAPRLERRQKPPEDVLYDLRPQPSQTRQQQRRARRPPTVTHATATTFVAERRSRGATHLVPPPLKARPPRPGTTPNRTGATPQPTSSVPAPVPTPDVCPHSANAPLPPPSRIPTKLRSGDHARVPTGPRTLTPQLPTHPDSTGLRGLPLAHSKKKCFSIAMGHTLVVLEMH